MCVHTCQSLLGCCPLSFLPHLSCVCAQRKEKCSFVAEIESGRTEKMCFAFQQQEEKLSDMGRRQLTLFSEHNRSSDLSDILEEEEEEELSSEAVEEKKWDQREPCSQENGEKVTCPECCLWGAPAQPSHAISSQEEGLG